MARFGTKLQSVGVAYQPALTTEGSTFSYMVAEVGVPDTTQKSFDLLASAGSFGSYFAPATGAKAASIKMKFADFGFKRSYDPENTEPGVTAAIVHAHAMLVGCALGSASASATSAAEFLQAYGLHRCNFTASKGATYGSADVATVTSALEIIVGGGNGSDYKSGQFFLCDSSKTAATPSMSWIKTIATDTLTFADACGTIPVVNDNTYPTVVAALTKAQPVPFTIHLLGSEAEDKIALIGGQIDGWKCTLKNGEPPMWELDISFIGIIYYATGGGLQALTIRPTLPYPMIGVNGGRVTVGVNGSAMGAVTVGEITIEGKNVPAEVGGLGASTGIAERIVVNREITVSVKWPRSSGDVLVGGQTPWADHFTNGTEIALATYSGTVPGTCQSWFLPALHLMEQPKLIDEGGLKYEELKLRPGEYAGDTSSTAPADTVVRHGWA